MKKLMLKLISSIIITTIFTLNISAAIPSDNVFYNNPEKIKKVALTFDDGPHPRYTKQILEILREYNVTATFFIIGTNAINYPDTLMAVADSGCEIANHTFTHKKLSKMNCDEIKKEIQDCQKTIYDLIGVETALFRPPEGACIEQVKYATHELNYNMILWSIDTKDWAHTPSDIIAEKVISNIKDGDIILMHDYISGVNTTCEALEIIIPKLIEMGYEFVTVSELIN